MWGQVDTKIQNGARDVGTREDEEFIEVRRGCRPRENSQPVSMSALAGLGEFDYRYLAEHRINDHLGAHAIKG